MKTAARLDEMTPFRAMDLMARAQRLETEGRSIVHFEVGEPDFPTPPRVIAAAQAYLQRGRIAYTPALGLPALRRAIAGFYGTRYGIDLDPERVVVTAGGSAALLLSMGLLLDPGDELLLGDPGYPCNLNIAAFCGARPRPIAVGADSSYQPSAAQVAAAWSPRSRALLLASPSNPTGTMLDAAALRALYDIVAERGGSLVVDEIYHGLTYGAAAATALAVADDVFVVGSFSKYFGMTGWRLGWLVVPAGLSRQVEKLAQNLYISSSAPAQHAALAAFDAETLALLEQRRVEFGRRRDLMLAGLRRLGFGVAVVPQGAFYLYADSSHLAADSFELAHDLLERGGVAVTPGIDFGRSAAEKHLRFAYTVNEEQIMEGLRRIERFAGGVRGN